MIEAREEYAGKIAEIKYGDKSKAGLIDPSIEVRRQQNRNKAPLTPLGNKKNIADYFKGPKP